MDHFLYLSVIWWIFLAALISFMLTGVLRRYALRKSLLDIPNMRSSHSVPTPRGGGIAIVSVILVSMLLFWFFDLLSDYIFYGIFGAGGSVALIGWLDDHGHVAAWWRLLVHFIAALWALYWLGGLPPLILPAATIDLGLFGYIMALFYLVWLLNLYNFMDGIDGIAGIEAVTVCLGGTVLYLLSSASVYAWFLPVLLASASLGFLLWNFPKAKIFMGDAGSGFIGILLGIFSIQAAWITPELLWGWLILLGVFLVDATVTLIRRILRHDKLHEAHRTHAYQWASRRWGHPKVTLAVAFINIFWLLPMAILSVILPKWGIMLMLVAFLPLIWLAIRQGAGRLEREGI